MMARSLKPMICASLPTSRRYCISAPTQCAIASRSMSFGSDIPRSASSCSPGRDALSFEVAVLVDHAQPKTGVKKAVQVFLGFNLLVSGGDRHFAGCFYMRRDGGKNFTLSRKFESQERCRRPTP